MTRWHPPVETPTEENCEDVRGHCTSANSNTHQIATEKRRTQKASSPNIRGCNADLARLFARSFARTSSSPMHARCLRPDRVRLAGPPWRRRGDAYHKLSKFAASCTSFVAPAQVSSTGESNRARPCLARSASVLGSRAGSFHASAARPMVRAAVSPGRADAENAGRPGGAIEGQMKMPVRGRDRSSRRNERTPSHDPSATRGSGQEPLTWHPRVPGNACGRPLVRRCSTVPSRRRGYPKCTSCWRAVPTLGEGLHELVARFWQCKGWGLQAEVRLGRRTTTQSQGCDDNVGRTVRRSRVNLVVMTAVGPMTILRVREWPHGCWKRELCTIGGGGVMNRYLNAGGRPLAPQPAGYACAAQSHRRLILRCARRAGRSAQRLGRGLSQGACRAGGLGVKMSG